MAETIIYDVQPLSAEDREYIKQTLWPKSTSLSIAEYGSYFDFFHDEIKSLTFPRNRRIEPTLFAMQTYRDFAEVVKLLDSNVDSTRKEIANQLRQKFPGSTEAQAVCSMELTARLWLTVQVKSSDYPVGSPSNTDIQWLDGTTLKKIVEDCFSKSSYTPSEPDKLRIARSFTLPKLSKLCRIKVCWTHKLRDHLYYDRSRTMVHIYPHKAILTSHLNESSKVFPEGLLKETIRTLELLFPAYEESTMKYLQREGQDFYRGSTTYASTATSFGEFEYWRTRLMELHDVFHQAPRSIPQMWNDRRNPMQWWTFWLAAFIALVVVFSTVISAYTGFWQVRHAEKSYQLALLQACASSNPPMRLCNGFRRKS